jgi:hypothetical protein
MIDINPIRDRFLLLFHRISMSKVDARLPLPRRDLPGMAGLRRSI